MNQTNCAPLDDVITDNQNLIYSITQKFDNRLQDDLYQVGVIGMIDAYKHFDPSRNTKFSTYAYPYIFGEMRRFVREDKGIKISRDIIYLSSKIEHARDLLRQKLKKEPSIQELAFYLEIDENKIVEALQVNNRIKSIDEPINDEGRELTLKDVVGQVETYDKLDLISLRDELSRLSFEEKTLLEKRYVDGMTQCETATILGISQVEVSRMEKRLRSSLKSRLS